MDPLIDVANLDGQSVLLNLPSLAINELGRFEFRPHVAPEHQLSVALSARAAGHGKGQTPVVQIAPDSYRYIREHPDQSVARYLVSERLP